MKIYLCVKQTLSRSREPAYCNDEKLAPASQLIVIKTGGAFRMEMLSPVFCNV